MLSEFVLRGHEHSIKEFSSLCTGGEHFEYLSKKGAETVSEMLATIRELQARVAAVGETLRLTRISNDALRERAFEAEVRVAELERGAALEAARKEEG